MRMTVYGNYKLWCYIFQAQRVLISPPWCIPILMLTLRRQALLDLKVFISKTRYGTYFVHNLFLFTVYYTVLGSIKLKLFPVPVRISCCSGKLIFVIFYHVLRYLRMLYIVWSLMRRRILGVSPADLPYLTLYSGECLKTLELLFSCFIFRYLYMMSGAWLNILYLIFLFFFLETILIFLDMLMISIIWSPGSIRCNRNENCNLVTLTSKCIYCSYFI